MAGYADFNRDIKEGNIGKLYVFCGEEAYLREHCLNLLQKTLLPDGAECFNLHKFSGKGLTLRELADAADGVPFMCEKKLVIAEDFDLMAIPSAERGGWVTFLEGLSESCCLVFVYNTIQYKPDGRSKIQAALNQNGKIIEFTDQDDSQLVTWIARRFQALGKQADRTLCQHLIFRCGHGMTALKSEIEKIAAFNDTGRISQEDIDEVTVPVLEAVAFDLTDAVAEGKTKKAAELLQTLQWMREPPEVLLGALGRTLRGLYAARLAVEQRKTTRQVMELCGFKSAYPAEKMMRSAKRLTLDWCENALLACRQADAKLKGEGREGALEWLIAKIV